MDVAVEDGVDVLSLSLGAGSLPFDEDGIALGAFTAIQKGIFVACSAGNSGPFNTSLSNEAPWILTVGASTLDRKLVSTVSLGNKELLDGETLFQPKDFSNTFLPLVYPGATGVQNWACKQVEIIVKKKVSCSKTIPEAQLNYPSFAITLASGQNKTYTRTVTNVGAAMSTYTISVQNVNVPHDSKVEVDVPYAEGAMAWGSDKYLVRSPFSIKFV
ncbi:hypothetical protein L2E82_47571 [Cichorium intybus]|uniref:Uncharacterized protein n=1 Tax=Cichorium intybus TaxID=13427 RepID=A0ACB8YW40_CICIN|nr:hypothetical protein L2E82_47571 [Cichorium intybus]